MMRGSHHSINCQRIMDGGNCPGIDVGIGIVELWTRKLTTEGDDHTVHKLKEISMRVILL